MSRNNKNSYVDQIISIMIARHFDILFRKVESILQYGQGSTLKNRFAELIKASILDQLGFAEEINKKCKSYGSSEKDQELKLEGMAAYLVDHLDVPKEYQRSCTLRKLPTSLSFLLKKTWDVFHEASKGSPRAYGEMRLFSTGNSGSSSSTLSPRS